MHRIKYPHLRYIVIVVVSIIYSTSAIAETCDLGDSEISSLLALDFETFDQSGDGWRRFARRDCDALAALLIERYLEESQPPQQHISLLHFHAGQMRARNGEAKTAIAHFERSFEVERKSVFADWNSYVKATIGFLERDRAKVEAMRDKLLEQPVLSLEKYPFLPPEWDGKRANLDRVEGFLACWDKSYRESGQPPCTRD